MINPSVVLLKRITTACGLDSSCQRFRGSCARGESRAGVGSRPCRQRLFYSFLIPKSTGKFGKKVMAPLSARGPRLFSNFSHVIIKQKSCIDCGFSGLFIPAPPTDSLLVVATAQEEAEDIKGALQHFCLFPPPSVSFTLRSRTYSAAAHMWPSIRIWETVISVDGRLLSPLPPPTVCSQVPRRRSPRLICCIVPAFGHHQHVGEQQRVCPSPTSSPPPPPQDECSCC